MRKATAKRKPVRKATKKKTTRKKRALPNAWSAKDVGYLKKNYKTQTAPQIAKVLKRTVAAVRAKATTLGLKKGVVRKKAAAKKKARKVVARKRTMKKKPVKKATAKKRTRKPAKKKTAKRR